MNENQIIEMRKKFNTGKYTCYILDTESDENENDILVWKKLSSALPIGYLQARHVLIENKHVEVVDELLSDENVEVDCTTMLIGKYGDYRTNFFDFYDKDAEYSIRNTHIISSPPKEAPSRMIENSTSGMDPLKIYKNIQKSDFKLDEITLDEIQKKIKEYGKNWQPKAMHIPLNTFWNHENVSTIEDSLETFKKMSKDEQKFFIRLQDISMGFMGIPISDDCDLKKIYYSKGEK